ncbi:MAG: hypothetical protein JXR34_01335 [Bacteroidales bacterium]|nr:hypothetical protein [Bacteroidales bacterium]
MKRLVFVLYLSILIFAVSCSQPEEIVLEKSIENGLWNKFTPLVWDSVVIPDQGPYQLVLEIEKDSRFVSEQLIFQLISESHSGEMRNQVFELPIANFEVGEHQGPNLQFLRKDLESAGNFAANGVYHIEFISLMPYLETPGVNKIRLIFRK